MEAYTHTQRAPLAWILLGIGALFALLSLAVARGPAPAAGLVFACPMVVCAGLAACFASLTTRDAGDRLEIAFGPLPLFARTVAYARIESFRVARSSLLDGWGIHWVPGRGWTWNLWGFDCVELVVDGRTLRVGTDRPHDLAAHLATRVQRASSASRSSDTELMQ